MWAVLLLTPEHALVSLEDKRLIYIYIYIHIVYVYIYIHMYLFEGTLLTFIERRANRHTAIIWTSAPLSEPLAQVVWHVRLPCMHPGFCGVPRASEWLPFSLPVLRLCAMGMNPGFGPRIQDTSRMVCLGLIPVLISCISRTERLGRGGLAPLAPKAWRLHLVARWRSGTGRIPRARRYRAMS